MENLSIKENIKQAGRTTAKWFRRLLIFAFVAFIAFIAFILLANYSDGSRTGYVTKISRKGYIFKTYEGELNFGFFGGATGTNRPVDNVWIFSVSDYYVADQVRKASESGEKVTLFYKEKYLKIFFIGDTKYLVYKVEPSF